MSGVKRVAFLTTDFKPLRGGIAAYLYSICRGLASLGCEVVVYSTVPGSAGLGTERCLVVPLKQRPLRKLGKRLGDFFPPARKMQTWRYYRRLRKMAYRETALLKEKADRVVIGYWCIESHFWCEACRTLGIPYKVVVHGAELVQKLLGPSIKWREKDLSSAEGLIAVSRATAEVAARLTDRAVPCRTLYPAPDFVSCAASQREDGQRRKKDWGIPQNARVLLTVARLVRRKGVDLVIEALASLESRAKDAYYLVAGEGPEKTFLKEKARSLGLESRVLFLGEVTDNEKWILLGLCDIFLSPIRIRRGVDYEGFGSVFLEAALAGKPAIGGRTGGVPEAVVDGQTGILVRTEDFHETARAVERLLGDEALRMGMGRAARERLLRKFTPAHQVRRMADVFEINT